jgi:hypothetical protein
MQLKARMRAESGSVIVLTMLVVVMMLGLGLALLSLNDEQARQSGVERTRDRAFNVAESVLTSEAYSLARAWPTTGALAPSGAAGTCSSTGVGAVIGAIPVAGSAVARIQPTVSAAYSGPEYAGTTWQVKVCDDTAGAPTSWSNGLLSNLNYDQNANNRMWIRAQATVGGRIRAVAGLVDLGSTEALPPNMTLINGSMSVDIPTALGSDPSLLTNVLGLVLGKSDSLITGRIGIRCGVYSTSNADDCLGGNGLAPLINVAGLLGSTVASNALTQYPGETAVSPEAVDQFRSQAIATGTYVTSTAGTTASTNPPTCTKPAGITSKTIWFIEQVGTGDQFCKIPLTSPQPAMIVVGRGRLLVRGNNNWNSKTSNTLTSVIYALNLQRPTPDSVSPAQEIVRIDQAGRVVGAVYTDGNNARVGLYPVIDCGLLGLGCVLNAVLGLLGTQLGSGGQGPLIEYNDNVVSAIRVFTTSGVVPGTFRDLAGGI